jgi:hypothetical protein
VAGKRKHATQITTLRKPDGTLTKNLYETQTQMLRHFTPAHNQNDDTEYHKQLRTKSQESIDTADDKEFTVQEIKNVVASMGEKRCQGRTG